METIEKMKQPKTIQHKKKISKSITDWWVERKEEVTHEASIDSKQLNRELTGSFTLSGSLSGTNIILISEIIDGSN